MSCQKTILVRKASKGNQKILIYFAKYIVIYRVNFVNFNIRKSRNQNEHAQQFKIMTK